MGSCANPGLKVNRRFYFSCLKTFSKANFKIEIKISQGRNLMLKSQKNSLISYLTGLKIDANPGLA